MSSLFYKTLVRPAQIWEEGRPIYLGMLSSPPNTTIPSLDVAAIQLPQRFGDPASTLAELRRVLASGLLQGADLALLPEAIFSGYVSPSGDFNLRPFAETIDGPTAQALSALAQTYRMILAGPLIEAGDNEVYNSLLIFDATGERIGHYRKRHPWYPERWATPSLQSYPSIEIRGLRITAAICFDINFVGSEAASILDEADLLLFPSAWVDVPGEGDLRARLLPPLARKHHISILNANWGLSRPFVWGQGASRIIDAQGRELCRTQSDRGAQVVRARVTAMPRDVFAPS